MDSHVLCWSTRVYHLGMLQRTVGRILENRGVMAVGLLALPRLLKVCRLLLHEMGYQSWSHEIWSKISHANLNQQNIPWSSPKRNHGNFPSTPWKTPGFLGPGVHQRDRFEEVVVFFQGMPVEENSGVSLGPKALLRRNSAMEVPFVLKEWFNK